MFSGLGGGLINQMSAQKAQAEQERAMLRQRQMLAQGLNQQLDALRHENQAQQFNQQNAASAYGFQNAVVRNNYFSQANSLANTPQSEWIEPIPPAPTRRCQSCGFEREAYNPSVNLSPKTCGNCG